MTRWNTRAALAAIMKNSYDFSHGKRGCVIPTEGKTRITIYLDNGILQRVLAESERTGKAMQVLLNEALARSVRV